LYNINVLAKQKETWEDENKVRTAAEQAKKDAEDAKIEGEFEIYLPEKKLHMIGCSH